MRFLITSGGTAVPIDPVRSITNASTGRFGSHLAAAALTQGAEVSYLAANQALSPFSLKVDFNLHADWLNEVERLQTFTEQHRHHYQEYRYQDYADYADKLQHVIETDKPDVIMLAAAVSDYLPQQVSENKIRSGGDLAIQLVPAPKIIHHVREWAPDAFIVGFKLLVNASDTQLIAEATRILSHHQLDMVIANDLASIRRGAHEVIVVNKDGSHLKIAEQVAPSVIAYIMQRQS